MNKINKLITSMGVLCACLAAALPAHAQSYPAKPIRIIVPYAAGGGTDTVGRALAQRMTESMGQQIVIELPDRSVITVTAVMIRGNRVRLAVLAPPEVIVDRAEIATEQEAESHGA